MRDASRINEDWEPKWNRTPKNRRRNVISPKSGNARINDFLTEPVKASDQTKTIRKRGFFKLLRK